MVYLVFAVGYDQPMHYAGVYESYELAEAAIAKFDSSAPEVVYSTEYKIFPVRLNSAGL